MVSAYAVTDEKGRSHQLVTTIGTGGHGDSSEVYHKTYTEIPSMVTYVSESVPTKNRDGKGKIIYQKVYDKKHRANTLYEIEKINPLAYSSFMEIKGVNNNTKIKCYDLIDTKEGEDGNAREFKVGISVVIEKFKAVIIKRKVQLFVHFKPVRTFKTYKLTKG